MEQLTLFDDRKHTVPLASRIRPVSLEEFVGQQHLLDRGNAAAADREGSDFLDDLLGAAWCGKDHSGQHHCRKDKSKLH